MKEHKIKSIKKSLPRLAILMILLFLVVIIPVNIYLQIIFKHNSQQENALESFGQLEQLIRNNIETIEKIKEDFKDRCIRSADVVAYAISFDNSIIYDLDLLDDLANKLEVDEIHYFNNDGVIVSGTHPEYYNFTFDSGEQMNFFKPMLEDKHLKLCQDIMPNTAESKNMQYAAVWLEDGSGIIQIGMEPRRLEEEIEERSLENVVSQLPFEINGYLHIVDNNTNKIIASSKKDLIGLDVSNIDKVKMHNDGEINMFHQDFNGAKYCVYTKNFNDYTFIRTHASLMVVLDIIKSSMLLMFYIIIGTVCIILAIRWYIQNKIIKNLEDINNELQKIEDGDIANISLKTGISELERLVFYINQMLDNIRLNYNKLSYVLDKAKIPLGIIEKNNFYKKIIYNNYLLHILDIDDSEDDIDKLVLDKLRVIKENIVDEEDNIYKYINDDKTKYLRIEMMKDDQNIVEYISDISLWWNELHNAKIQSEIDILTGLYNRRGFYRLLDEIFENDTNLKCASILMIDADNLKMINDSLGHHFGDEYLIALAKNIEIKAQDKAICSRLGGDEYAILIYGENDLESLNQRIDNIKDIRNIRFESKENNKIYYLEFSLGIGYYGIDGNNYHELLRIADKNMYDDKKKRKGL